MPTKLSTESSTIAEADKATIGIPVISAHAESNLTTILFSFAETYTRPIFATRELSEMPPYKTAIS